MRREVVFLHLPKTGGTSVRQALERTYRDQIVLRDYGPEPESTPELRELLAQGRTAELRKTFGKPDRRMLLSGHFPVFTGVKSIRRGAARYWDVFNAESFVTFLRNPIDRVISEYVHFVNLRGWTASFEEFIDTDKRCERISLPLAQVDLDSFGFIGFMEEFEASCAALQQYIGVEMPVSKENVGNYATIDTAGLRERFGDRLAELSRADTELYERLRRERSGIYRAPGADESVAGSYLGRVRLAGAAAAGWLVNTAREFICEVEVLQNGVPIRTAKADRYREKPKLEGRSRSGVCGFRINLDDLRRGDGPQIFTVRAKGSEYELPGSPLQLG